MAFFHSATASINSVGDLCVAFDERGLGNEDIDYVLTANGVAFFECRNRGGHNPAASNKESVSGFVSGGGTFSSRNGRVRETICTDGEFPSPSSDINCGQGQRLVLVRVEYSNILLEDTTNNISIRLPGVSRDFVTS
ncbi:hypothetical protein [Peribacillus asahii]|uniref:hypothetical protein n=1 Tax=Peribacillus asahii TaxID=228899 RepID=UPI00207A87A2|nr:hypothetical protein [Peribacillus asahii]USK70719.1 hypothetical protein LIS76_02710 [Peribacillus asahii]